ncbi:hypothetical protein ACP4OV_019583 [Aristida adscensionis]
MKWQLLLFSLLAGLRPCSSQTNSEDVAALQALTKNWQNEPKSWTGSTDPCTSWDGISCSAGRVTDLILPSTNLQGTLSNTIDQLSALKYLDLSNNPKLGGPLTPSLGNLKQLTNLNLLGCSFTGNIPDELGNLSQLTFLITWPSLKSFLVGLVGKSAVRTNSSFNKFNPWVGSTRQHQAFADPSILPINSHFGENRLTGPISESLFNANMSLIHVFFDNNKFTGPIPESLGLVQTLQNIRLDQNQFSGPVPNSIGNLKNLTGLCCRVLANNLLNGTVPDLSNATQLNYVDLSNNNFSSSPAPGWLSTLTSLNTLFLDNDGLTGTLPSALFSFPQLQQVSLANNALGGTLDMTSNVSSQLRFVNLTNNQINDANIGPGYNISLILTGNPVCLHNTDVCKLSPTQQGPCGAGSSCPNNQSSNPATSQSCACTTPFQGFKIFIALILYSLF